MQVCVGLQLILLSIGCLAVLTPDSCPGQFLFIRGMSPLHMILKPAPVREQEVGGAPPTSPGLFQDLHYFMMGVQPVKKEGGDGLDILTTNATGHIQGIAG